jgi:hypothetical protein
MKLQNDKETVQFTRESAQNIDRSFAYQGVDACNYSIHNEDEEDLIVCMAHTVTYPNAMMVLTINR